MANNKQKVIDVALAEVGYLEKASDKNLDNKTANAGKNNYTKYWRDLCPSYQKEPWCQCFVNWCFNKAYGTSTAKKLLYETAGWTYYTPTGATYFQNNKRWFTSNPQPGDIIYFKNSTRIHHVGLVYKVDSNRVYTIEGNTDSGSAVIANGGEVAKKDYPLGRSDIAGYGRPMYDADVITTYSVVAIDTGKKGMKVTAVLNIRNGATTVGTSVIGTYKTGTCIFPTSRTRLINGVYWFKTDKGYVSGKYLQGWVKDSDATWWYNDCGKYPTSEWKEIDGVQYYFTKDGYMAASTWIKSTVKECWYWVDANGAWDKSKTTKIKPRNTVI